MKLTQLLEESLKGAVGCIEKDAQGVCMTEHTPFCEVHSAHEAYFLACSSASHPHDTALDWVELA